MGYKLCENRVCACLFALLFPVPEDWFREPLLYVHNRLIHPETYTGKPQPLGRKRIGWIKRERGPLWGSGVQVGWQESKEERKKKE